MSPARRQALLEKALAAEGLQNVEVSAAEQLAPVLVWYMSAFRVSTINTSRKATLPPHPPFNVSGIFLAVIGTKGRASRRPPKMPETGTNTRPQNFKEH